MTRHAIPIEVLEDMAKDQATELRAGDIFIIRTGFTKWYETASQEERNTKIKGDGFAFTGVEGSMRTVEWLWNHHFAAVAGDSISWEVRATRGNPASRLQSLTSSQQWPFSPDCKIHEYQLAMWGGPIGEIWDLERLAEMCQQQNRWASTTPSSLCSTCVIANEYHHQSFFFTSAPLNIPGGVASPPNALCIF